LEKITKQAYASIAIFGLNEKVGNISYYDSSGNQEYSFTKPYSEKTAELIDEEVKKLVDLAYQKTKSLLLEHRDQLDLLAKRLLEREVLFKEDLEDIFGKRKWESPEMVEPKVLPETGQAGKKPEAAPGTGPSPNGTPKSNGIPPSGQPEDEKRETGEKTH
jgi:cell division protease FtsH